MKLKLETVLWHGSTYIIGPHFTDLIQEYSRVCWLNINLSIKEQLQDLHRRQGRNLKVEEKELLGLGLVTGLSTV